MIRLICPGCKERVEVPDDAAGREANCGKCGQRFRVPDPVTASSAQPQQRGLGSVPPPPPGASMQPVAGGPKNEMATASLVLGIGSWLCGGPFFGIPAIILGHLALAKAKRSHGQIGGQGLAIAGLAFGYVNLAIMGIGIVAGLLFPALSNARENVQRASCQNNEKQMGLVFKMFANENPGGVYPALASEPGKLMFANEAEGLHVVYPEYLTDLAVLICPGDDNAPDITESSTLGAEAVDDHSYYYLGYTVTSEEEFLAFAEGYRQQIASGGNFIEDLPVAEGAGTAGGNALLRLRNGIEQRVAELNQADETAVAARIPVLVEYPRNHMPPGGNILYLDGHVEFIHYPGEWPMTEETVATLEALDNL